jgi:alkane 1-monooxygenase
MKITFDSIIPVSIDDHSVRMFFEKIKYTSVLVFPLAAFLAFVSTGILTLLPAILLYVAVPLSELLLRPDKRNFNKAEKESRVNDRFFDYFLYAFIFILVSVLIFFLATISDPNLATFDFIGRTISMGILCGIAINLGHELGHRTNRFEQFLGEIALLISFENHFLPYHNLGHHRFVATPHDPATARRNEPVYTFWFRSQCGSYMQAWKFEFEKLRRRKVSIFSLHNRMLGYTIAQVTLVMTVYFIFGWKTLLAFVIAAIIGKLMLETVNYIEHYGLVRKMNRDGKYERVRPKHSWNSDHPVSRSIMFELSRHSDHHFRASKHYQVLDSFSESPQMPTGYPGMMIFALISPIWFRYMNREIDRQQNFTGQNAGEPAGNKCIHTIRLNN